MYEASEKLDFTACFPLNVLVERVSEVSCDWCMPPTAPAVDSRGVPGHLGRSHPATDGWWRYVHHHPGGTCLGSRVLTDIALTLEGRISIFSDLFYSVTSV